MVFRLQFLLALVALAKGISIVQDIKITPILYSESDSITLSWKQPADLGSNSAADITYGVKYCAISTTQCTGYGNITETEVAMRDFERGLNQIYTYHITVYGKDGTKSEEKVDLIRFEKRDTCAAGMFTCKEANACVREVTTCDGIQNCADNSDETTHANCDVPDIPLSPGIGKITETSLEIKYDQLGQKDRVKSYKIEAIVAATDKLLIRRTVSHERYAQNPKSTTFVDLVPGTQYKFRIAAVNPAGQGLWSREETYKTDGVAPPTTTTTAAPKVTGVPGDIPAVTNVKVVPKEFAESSTVVVTWDPPTEKADLVDKYIFTYCQINRNNTCKTVTESEPRKVVVDGLENSLLYTYHISAVGKNGESGTDISDPFKPAEKRTCPSDQFTCTKSDGCTLLKNRCNTIPDCADSSDESADGDCKSPLNVPTDLSVVLVKTTGFTVKYKQVPESDLPTKYDIYIFDISTEKGFTKRVNHARLDSRPVTVKIEGLTGDTEYKVRMRAVNSVGDGKWTEEIKVKTETFGPVLNVQLTSVEFKENSAFVISFDQPIGFDASKKFTYQVVYCRINKPDTCKTTAKSSVTDVEITGLDANDIYQWEVKIFDESDEAGKSIKDTYKTQQRRKCLSTEFKCVESPQCVLAEQTDDRRCNTITDCQDGSDEKPAAGCKSPANQPEGVKTEKLSDGKSYEFTFSNLPGTDRITHFEVEIRNTVTDKLEVSSTQRHTILSGQVVKFQWDGMVQGNQYEIRFRGVNPAGEGPWSVPVKFGSNVKTTSRTPFPPPDTNETTESGTTTAQTAGIAIGIILALIIIIIIVVIVMKNRNKSSSAKPQGKYNNGGANNGAKSNNGYEMDRRP